MVTLNSMPIRPITGRLDSCKGSYQGGEDSSADATDVADFCASDIINPDCIRIVWVVGLSDEDGEFPRCNLRETLT